MVVASTVEPLEGYHALDYMANVAGFKAVQNLEAWDGKAVVRCLGFRGNAFGANSGTYGTALYHHQQKTGGERGNGRSW